MPTDVVMPQMGESIFEGTITKWLKQPGDKITRDEPLFEISTDKVDAEIPAPASGVLKEIKAEVGKTVQVNAVVAVIDESGAAAGRRLRGTSKAAEPASASSTAAANPADAASACRRQEPATEVVMPQMGESIFEGTITKWLKKVGEQVTRDEPLFEISTDKVDAEIPAPVSGVLTEIKAEVGQDGAGERRGCGDRRNGRGVAPAARGARLQPGGECCAAASRATRSAARRSGCPAKRFARLRWCANWRANTMWICGR